MKSPKTSILNKETDGFTLVEVIITMGILSVLTSLGLFLSMDMWRASSFHSERDTVISLLYKARSRAVSNVNENSHGLYIDTDNHKYVVYEGDTYDKDSEKNQEFVMSETISFSGSDNILFAARKATTDGGSITITGEGKEGTITVNEEGGVIW